MSVEEVRQLPGCQPAKRLFAMLVVFALLGMRRSEVLGLRWKDVDLEQGSLRIGAGCIG